MSRFIRADELRERLIRSEWIVSGEALKLLDKAPSICGVIAPNQGPNGEPLACAFFPDHETEHSWAWVPTIAAPEPGCSAFGHWRLACPNCGGPVHIISRTCFGPDAHNTYGCSAYCGWRGRGGLAHGSPSYVHDEALHAADVSGSDESCQTTDVQHGPVRAERA